MLAPYDAGYGRQGGPFGGHIFVAGAAVVCIHRCTRRRDEGRERRGSAEPDAPAARTSRPSTSGSLAVTAPSITLICNLAVIGGRRRRSTARHHGFLARRLGRILERAAEAVKAAAKARVYVQAPMDTSTPAGARKPGGVVIEATAASSARRLGRSLYHGADVLLAVEVVSRGSGSQREDRGCKVTEYALAGIGQYWIVDFDPEPQIQVLRRTDDTGRYGTSLMFGGDDTVKIEDPFPVSFPLSDLQDFA